MSRARLDAVIESLTARVFRLPTDRPESDGTFAWDSTTLLTVHVVGGGHCGFGYSYTAAAAASVVRELLQPAVAGRSALDVAAGWEAMLGAIRNIGQTGLAMTAVAAVDAALWDLKAKLLEVPLLFLLGRVRNSMPIYGSGGFTSYDDLRLADQLAGWVAAGIPRVKMKIGRQPERDPQRVRAARQAVGPEAALYVDANGAFAPRPALAMAERLAEYRVTWYEEPVMRTDREGLRWVRVRVPAGMEIAGGEYGFGLDDFRLFLEHGCLDVLQADASRCGISGFLQVAALCDAFHRPLSSHCAPSLHLHLGCALQPVRHMEYFHDHVRIESLLFDGFCAQQAGMMTPDLSRPGLGIELKEREAEKYAL